MARSRVPKPGAVVATIARLLGLSASVAVLAVLVYESVNWDAKGKTYGVAISAVSRRLPAYLAIYLPTYHLISVKS